MKKNTGRYLLATDELTCQHSAGQKEEFTVLSVFPRDQKSNSVRTSFFKSDSAIEILFFPGAREAKAPGGGFAKWIPSSRTFCRAFSLSSSALDVLEMIIKQHICTRMNK